MVAQLVILAFRRLSQVDYELKASLDSISRPSQKKKKITRGQLDDSGR